MLASAARTYLNRFAVRAGRSGRRRHQQRQRLSRTALDAAAAGADVTIVDVRAALPAALARALPRGRGRAARRPRASTARGGARCLPASPSRLRPAAARGRAPAAVWPATSSAVSGGWSPAVHLAASAGGKPPGTTTSPPSFRRPPPASSAAGAGTGTFASADCDRRRLGRRPRRRAGLRRERRRRRRRRAGACEPSDRWDAPSAAVWEMPAARARRFVDFQNDVTVKDVELAHREGYGSVEHLKRYTTLGMATDQGKTSNIAALAHHGGLRGHAVPEVGTTTFRPPYTPVAIGASPAARRAALPADPPHADARLARRATVPSSSTPGSGSAAGTTAGRRDAGAAPIVARRCAVRRTVGIVDVSTLGKIDVQGPDAAGVPQPRLRQRLRQARRSAGRATA